MKRRVLQLVTDLDVGGAPLIVKQLAQGLSDSGYEVMVVGLGGEGAVGDELRGRSIETHFLNASGVCDVRIFAKLARLIGRFGPDILHSHLVHANVVGRIVGGLMGVGGIIATIHTAEQGKQWHLTAENLTCRLSDITVCVSPSVRQHTQRYSQVPSEKLRVIANGINYHRFAHADPADPAELGLAPDKTTLIFVGRLDAVKNIDMLLRVVERLGDRHNLQCLIVGQGPQHQHLEKLSQQLGIADRVRFIGLRGDVERLLKAADIMIMPSRWEGFGMSALEAMASGVPVVASRTPGLADLIEHEQTGLLVDANNLEGFCQTVEKLIVDKDLARRLSQNAQKYAKDFTIQKMVNSYIRLYEKVIDPK